jgi:hypothetical protein
MGKPFVFIISFNLFLHSKEATFKHPLERDQCLCETISVGYLFPLCGALYTKENCPITVFIVGIISLRLSEEERKHIVYTHG